MCVATRIVRAPKADIGKGRTKRPLRFDGERARFVGSAAHGVVERDLDVRVAVDLVPVEEELAAGRGGDGAHLVGPCLRGRDLDEVGRAQVLDRPDGVDRPAVRVLHAVVELALFAVGHLEPRARVRGLALVLRGVVERLRGQREHVGLDLAARVREVHQIDLDGAHGPLGDGLDVLLGSGHVDRRRAPGVDRELQCLVRGRRWSGRSKGARDRRGRGLLAVTRHESDGDRHGRYDGTLHPLASSTALALRVLYVGPPAVVSLFRARDRKRAASAGGATSVVTNTASTNAA